jgi:hypothetical protein
MKYKPTVLIGDLEVRPELDEDDKLELFIFMEDAWVLLLKEDVVKLRDHLTKVLCASKGENDE